jgi:hypothetical protein
MTYDYTARYIHQHNHLDELGFAILGNKGRALMARSNIPLKSGYLLFREDFKTNADLDSLVIALVGTKKATGHEQLYGSNPKWMNLRRISEGDIQSEN